MKKITIGLLLLMVSNVTVFAQDLKKVRNALTLSFIAGGDAKLEEAKAEIDKAQADPKATAKVDYYLLRAEIYGLIAGNEALKAKYPDAAKQGLPALKKYLEMEPSFEKFKEDNYAGINGIYSAFFNNGINDFNAKNWDAAYANFKDVVEVSDIMIKNKWTTSVFDTTANLYAGISSQNANKEDESLKYYEKLADMKLKAKDYEHIYVFLPQYYTKKKDEANFKKYLNLGKQVYPEKTFWNDMEFEYITSNLLLAEITKKFDDDFAANKLTSETAMDYGNFFFNDKRIKELKPEEKKMFTEKATAAFKKASELDPANVLATYNVAISYYVQWEEAADAASNIKGITPEIKAKRAQADKEAIAASDRAIDPLEKAYKQLDEKIDKSKIEKNSETTSAKFLAAIYAWRRDKAKGKAAEYDMYDKKMQFYDKKY